MTKFPIVKILTDFLADFYFSMKKGGAKNSPPQGWGVGKDVSDDRSAKTKGERQRARTAVGVRGSV